MKFLSCVILWFTLSPFAQAALSTTVVWEVRPTNGLDTNGGGFDPGVVAPGTDFSQQNSTQVTYTDLVIGATTTQVTSAASPFGSTYPGNLIHIASGSGCTVGWFEILSVSGVTATLDRSAGTAASTCSGSLGGALKTLTQLNTNMSQSQIGWVKAESTITTAATITISYTTNSNTNGASQISGYTTTRGDNGHVTIQQSGAISFGGWIINFTPGSNFSGIIFRNFTLDCASFNPSRGLGLSGNTSGMRAENIIVKNCGGSTGGQSGSITFASTQATCFNCSVQTPIAGNIPSIQMDGGNGFNVCIDCTVIGGTASGFSGSYYVCIRCISANNTGASSDGFDITANFSSLVILDQCVAYGNGRDGIRLTPAAQITITNTVLYGNSGVGLNDTTGPVAAGSMTFNWNAFGGNGTDRTNVSAGANDVSLSGDPFVSGATGNFALSGTGGGAQGAGFPGVLQSGGTGHLDIGALQSQSSAGGGTFGAPIH